MSASRNHAEQPDVCAACGEKVLKTKHDAMFYYDDTKSRKHVTLHARCMSSVTCHAAFRA